MTCTAIHTYMIKLVASPSQRTVEPERILIVRKEIGQNKKGPTAENVAAFSAVKRCSYSPGQSSEQSQGM